MGAHAHGHRSATDAEVARAPRLVLLAFLALVGIATVAGLVALWPTGERPTATFAGQGVTFSSAEVRTVHEACPVRDDSSPTTGEAFTENCDHVEVELREGDQKGTVATVGVPPGVVDVVSVGDRLKIAVIPEQEGRPASFAYYGTERSLPLLYLTVLLVLVVALVARVRGLLALVGLGFAGLVLAKFMLPALLLGSSGLVVALVGSSAIMYVVLYLAHGLSIRTSTALAGTLVGVAVTAGLGLYAVAGASLSGLGDESDTYLRSQAPSLDFQGLLTCAIIIAGLGVLNDVTITQSSAVWELRAASPAMGRRQLFTSGMRIGRDHIASTIYTIVFAYAGAALAVLLLVTLYQRPLGDLLTNEAVAEELARTLASAIGLVLAVPATTAIAAATVAGPVRGRPGPE